ncbi:protein kinase [Candidatus Sumerlaeota bacterium]|nr:protein kinase [Candidatus Sumerlaeota bacterium]
MGVSGAITRNLQGLGIYRIDQLLGFNGMFASFKATETKSQKPALVVAVHQSWIADAGHWDAFSKSFDGLVGTDVGPGICPPLRNGRDASHYWCSYGWLDGMHVGARVRDTGLPSPADAFRWMAEVARGLATLHGRNQRHQIINPASIFLEGSGQVKLLHAGWGSLIRGCPDGLLNPSFSCILPFTAPEVAGGGEGDESSDVYALGANLFYLLTGAPPFWHDDPKQLSELIAKTPVDFGALRTALPRPAFSVLEEMLEHSAEERPVNIPALADRLEVAAKAIEARDEHEREQSLSRANIPVQVAPAVSATTPAPVGHQQPAGAKSPERDAKLGDERYVDHNVRLPNPMPTPLPVQQPPQVEAEPSQEPVPAAPSRRSNTTALVVGGVLLVLVVVGGLAGFLLLNVLKGKQEGKKTVAEEVAPDRKLGDASYEKYSQTAARLRILGQLAKGYFRQNGTWPSDVTDLKALGAKDEEMKDSWNRPLDARRGGFVVSSGANGKWDDDDDIWWDSERGVQDGFMPPKPAVAKP